MEADRTETHNLAGSEKERVNKMMREYGHWADTCGALPWPIR